MTAHVWPDLMKLLGLPHFYKATVQRGDVETWWQKNHDKGSRILLWTFGVLKSLRLKPASIESFVEHILITPPLCL